MMKVTLQVNLAPFDFAHAKALIPHHIETFGPQVQEVLLVYDENRKHRQVPPAWEQADRDMKRYLQEVAASEPKVVVRCVEYSQEARARVARFFMRGRFIPLYDFRGAPFYQYFYGLSAAEHDFVLHLDSDMFFGGGSGTWVSEAGKVLEDDPHVLTVSPHPGPPRPDGALIGQRCRVYGVRPHSYSFDSFSTRVFLIDRRRIARGIVPRLPGPVRCAYAMLKGFPASVTAEEAVSTYMRKHSLGRVDFLGEGSGLWSLHPLRRSPSFCRQIPSIIRRLKEMDLPPSQLGYYNFTDDFMDWSDAEKPYK